MFDALPPASSRPGVAAAAGIQCASEERITPLVEMRNVTFVGRGRRLIDGVSLRIEPGAPTVIMGPNGAGKSLLLRLAAGLLRPDSGQIAYRGGQDRPEDAIGFVFQRPVMLRRSVAQNLSHALGVAGVPRRSRAERVRALLARGRLESLRDQPARLLSGGEQQRLAMVRALASDPRLLLLDEPCASLDPEATGMIEGMLGQIVAEGVKIVMVTHDVGQARRLAGDVVFVHRGRIVEHAPAQTFFESPRTGEADGFLRGHLLTDH